MGITKYIKKRAALNQRTKKTGYILEILLLAMGRFWKPRKPINSRMAVRFARQTVTQANNRVYYRILMERVAVVDARWPTTRTRLPHLGKMFRP